MINETIYKMISGITSTRPEIKGGQELILYEIAAALYPTVGSIWVPFLSSGTLSHYLKGVGFRINEFQYLDGFDKAPPNSQAVYFGTPTIVDNTNLFPDNDTDVKWTKKKEREAVRAIMKACKEAGYIQAISGLGSGDISLEERMEDMGPGAKLICYKDFGVFEDWVIGKVF